VDVIQINQVFTSNGDVINEGNLQEPAGAPARNLFGGGHLFHISSKAAVLAYNLSQGHPFADANKRTVSGALEKFIKENRNGRGLIGHCADEYPITLDEFTVALGKIMPSRRINEKL